MVKTSFDLVVYIDIHRIKGEVGSVKVEEIRVNLLELRTMVVRTYRISV